MTYGEMTAGRIPSFTSDSPNFVCGEAMAMSQTATRPTPPPIAAPVIRPTTGNGHSLITEYIFASCEESRTFSSRVYETMRDIQLRSAPAQNV